MTKLSDLKAEFLKISENRAAYEGPDAGGGRIVR